LCHEISSLGQFGTPLSADLQAAARSGWVDLDEMVTNIRFDGYSFLHKAAILSAIDD
jgi:hypothetical protein